MDALVVLLCAFPCCVAPHTRTDMMSEPRLPSCSAELLNTKKHMVHGEGDICT